MQNSKKTSSILKLKVKSLLLTTEKKYLLDTFCLINQNFKAHNEENKEIENKTM